MSINYDNFFEQHIVLEDETVRLEPLEEKHFGLLLPVAMEYSIWEFTIAKIKTADEFRFYFDTAMEEKKNKKSYPFAIFDKTANKYAGCTRFGNIDFKNKKVEIGWTWISTSVQGTGFNKHCKYLLLHFGFDTLKLNRVELKTSSLNKRSQKAMLKIGAVQEGTLRRNIINDDGTIRDTIYFSFIAEEWPAIKHSIFKEFIA